MIKQTLTAFLLFFFLQACTNSASKKAYDLNNRLAGISTANHDKWIDISHELTASKQSHEFSKLNLLANDLRSFLSDKITEVNTIENFAGSEHFKASLLEFLQFEKKVADEGLSPYANMNKETTDEDIDAAFQSLLRAAEEEKAYVTKMRDAQQEFAKKNGFRVKTE